MNMETSNREGTGALRHVDMLVQKANRAIIGIVDGAAQSQASELQSLMSAVQGIRLAELQVRHPGFRHTVVAAEYSYALARLFCATDTTQMAEERQWRACTSDLQRALSYRRPSRKVMHPHGDLSRATSPAANATCEIDVPFLLNSMNHFKRLGKSATPADFPTEMLAAWLHASLLIRCRRFHCAVSILNILASAIPSSSQTASCVNTTLLTVARMWISMSHSTDAICHKESEVSRSTSTLSKSLSDLAHFIESSNVHSCFGPALSLLCHLILCGGKLTHVSTAARACLAHRVKSFHAASGLSNLGVALAHSADTLNSRSCSLQPSNVDSVTMLTSAIDMDFSTQLHSIFNVASLVHRRDGIEHGKLLSKMLAEHLNNRQNSSSFAPCGTEGSGVQRITRISVPSREQVSCLDPQIHRLQKIVPDPLVLLKKALAFLSAKIAAAEGRWDDACSLCEGLLSSNAETKVSTAEPHGLRYHGILERQRLQRLLLLCYSKSGKFEKADALGKTIISGSKLAYADLSQHERVRSQVADCCSLVEVYNMRGKATLGLELIDGVLDAGDVKTGLSLAVKDFSQDSWLLRGVHESLLHNNRAVLLFQLGRLQEALDAASTALRLAKIGAQCSKPAIGSSEVNVGNPPPYVMDLSLSRLLEEESKYNRCSILMALGDKLASAVEWLEWRHSCSSDAFNLSTMEARLQRLETAASSKSSRLDHEANSGASIVGKRKRVDDSTSIGVNPLQSTETRRHIVHMDVIAHRLWVDHSHRENGLMRQ